MSAAVLSCVSLPLLRCYNISTPFLVIHLAKCLITGTRLGFNNHAPERTFGLFTQNGRAATSASSTLLLSPQYRW